MTAGLAVGVMGAAAALCASGAVPLN